MKRVVIGAALATGAYLLYKFTTTEATQMAAGGNPTILGGFNLADPWLYAAIASGAILGRVVG